MNEKQQKILSAYDNGDISKEEAKDLIARATYEEYQSSQKPMSEIEAQVKAVSESGDYPKVNEMHPDIGVKTRMVYKNLSADDEAGFNYLQKQNPELEFKKTGSGNVIAKKRDGTDDWKWVDPPGFDAQDITDVAFDIPAGVAETAASAAGGLGGGLLGLTTGPAAPVAVPSLSAAGAASAGGATAAGLEALRQKFGQFAGVDQEMNPEQIKIAAKFGAISPLLLGTGAGGKMVAKETLKKGLSKAEADLLLKSQSGLIGKGVRATAGAVLPKVGELVSGVPTEVIKKGRDIIGKIREADAFQKEATVINDVTDKLHKSQAMQKAAASDAYGTAIKNLDVTLNVNEAQKPLIDLLGEYSSKLDRVKLDAQKAVPVTPKDKMIKAAYEAKIQQIGPQVIRQTPEFAAYEASLKAFKEKADNIVKTSAEFDNFNHVKSTLEKYTKNKEFIKGDEYIDYLNNLNDVTQIRKNANVAAKSQVDRDLIRTSKQVASNFESQLDALPTGKEFKDVKRVYKKTIDNDKILQKYFKDPAKTEDSLLNLASSKKAARRQEVLNLATDLNVDIVNPALEQKAIATFAKPSKEILSLGGTTSTSRSVPLSALGGLAGYYVGGQEGGGHGGGAVGAGLGAFFAGKLGSPSMLRKLMSADEKLVKASGMLKNEAPYTPLTQGKLWGDMYKTIDEQK